MSQSKRDAPPVFSVVYNVLMSALSVVLRNITCEWDKDMNKIKNTKNVTVLHAHKSLLKNPGFSVLTSTGAQTGGHLSPATVAISSFAEFTAQQGATGVPFLPPFHSTCVCTEARSEAMCGVSSL